MTDHLRLPSWPCNRHRYNSAMKTPIFAVGSLLLALAPGLLNAQETPAGWYADGARLVEERRARHPDIQPARNVILFLGDGMSLATVAAARILEGQLRGESGEENFLYFERFDRLALAKTYNTDQQTPDSAGTMTAIVTGVKTFAGGIAVDQLARRGDCESTHGRELVTLLDLAALAGLGTGVVTTTRITHATPAALFARVPDRRWESDRGLPPSARAAGCRDIARQMIEYDLGRGIDIILGGGRRAFLPATAADPEYPQRRGHRGDDRDLIADWQRRHPQGLFIWNQAQFDALPSRPRGPVLGLFEPDHMHYEHDRPTDAAGEPSIAEMTRRAIEVLQSRGSGYFLMVEGGRIDHAHHINSAWRALTDTIAFAEAVQVAHELTDERDTLIIVTADHAHSLNFIGYGERGNPITGLALRPGDEPAEERLRLDDSGRPMTVLKYASGPGHRDERPDFSQVDPQSPDFVQEATLPLFSASHAGEDVPVYATGPGSEAVFGVIEQNVLFHIMLQAQPALRRVAEAISGPEGKPDWRAAQQFAENPCRAAQLLTVGEC